MSVPSNDSVYGAVLRHDDLTIEIPLSLSVMNPDNFNPIDLMHLRALLGKLTHRDLNIAVPGWKFDGSIKAAVIQPDEFDNPTLILTVQL